MRSIRLPLLAAALTLTLISCTTGSQSATAPPPPKTTNNPVPQRIIIPKPEPEKAVKPNAETPVQTSIVSRGEKTAEQMTDFFFSHNQDADREQVMRMAKTYITEASAEGINSDIAWVQMCNETGFLKFNNLVTPDMHNYCGLGAIDKTHRGEKFATETLGIRAHIQHLHAYATPAYKHLKQKCIDPRYSRVRPRGKAVTIDKLTGTWAKNPAYGDLLKELLIELKKY